MEEKIINNSETETETEKEKEKDVSVLDYGINEAEVNHAIKIEQIQGLDLTDLPILIDVKNIDSYTGEEFALFRRNGFGGSDSSILVGVNPFSTVKELITQKLAKKLSAEEKAVGQLAAVRKGTDLEPLVIEKVIKALNLPTIKPPHMYKFKDYPYLKMNFDGVSIPNGHELVKLPPLVGKYIPTEIKIATAKGQRHYNPFIAMYSEMTQGIDDPIFRNLPKDISKERWTIEAKAKYYGIPQYYYTQVQQEIMALNAPYGLLAVLFEETWRLSIFFIWRDGMTQAKIALEGGKAWQRIEDLRQYPNLTNKI